ncbi:hypothetical protein [Streptomyces sp. WG5]|uniref:hypothetical protein n=1 Tax=Streptomyces sp. WG5 TaxID=3417648 RepID=UPI003CE7969A
MDTSGFFMRLTDEEADTMALALAIVVMGLEDGRLEEPDNEELVFQAMALITSYLVHQLEVDPSQASSLAADLLVHFFEKGALK